LCWGTERSRHSPDFTAFLQAIETCWYPLLVGTATALLTLATIGRFLLEAFYITDDSALFQHAGWYITHGATPYVDFWDLKPPLVYVGTTTLAVLTGVNMVLLHLAIDYHRRWGSRPRRTPHLSGDRRRTRKLRSRPDDVRRPLHLHAPLLGNTTTIPTQLGPVARRPMLSPHCDAILDTSVIKS
jgi:hypothetical protein